MLMFMVHIIHYKVCSAEQQCILYSYYLSNNTHNNIYEHSIMKNVFNKYKLALIQHSVKFCRDVPKKKNMFNSMHHKAQQETTTLSHAIVIQFQALTSDKTK